MKRNIETPNEAADVRAGVVRPRAMDVPRGSTVVLEERVKEMRRLVEVMDVDEE